MTDDFDVLLKENTSVLDNLKSKGIDLSRQRLMSFAHKFDAEDQARSFAAEVLEKGLKAAIYLQDDGDWDVIVSLLLTTGAQKITELETSLGQVAETFGGHADGWEFEDDDNVIKH